TAAKLRLRPPFHPPSKRRANPFRPPTAARNPASSTFPRVSLLGVAPGRPAPLRVTSTSQLRFGLARAGPIAAPGSALAPAPARSLQRSAPRLHPAPRSSPAPSGE